MFKLKLVLIISIFLIFLFILSLFVFRDFFFGERIDIENVEKKLSKYEKKLEDSSDWAFRSIDNDLFSETEYKKGYINYLSKDIPSIDELFSRKVKYIGLIDYIIKPENKDSKKIKLINALYKMNIDPVRDTSELVFTKIIDYKNTDEKIILSSKSITRINKKLDLISFNSEIDRNFLSINKTENSLFIDLKKEGDKESKKISLKIKDGSFFLDTLNIVLTLKREKKEVETIYFYDFDRDKNKLVYYKVVPLGYKDIQSFRDINCYSFYLVELNDEFKPVLVKNKTEKIFKYINLDIRGNEITFSSEDEGLVTEGKYLTINEYKIK